MLNIKYYPKYWIFFSVFHLLVAYELCCFESHFGESYFVEWQCVMIELWLIYQISRCYILNVSACWHYSTEWGLYCIILMPEMPSPSVHLHPAWTFVTSICWTVLHRRVLVVHVGTGINRIFAEYLRICERDKKTDQDRLEGLQISNLLATVCKRGFTLKKDKTCWQTLRMIKD